MKSVVLSASLVLIVALSYPVMSATIDDVTSCHNVSDSLARLSCYDAIRIDAAPATTAGKVSVTLVKAELRLQQKDFARSIFHNRIELVPTFQNSSNKTVVAIAHSTKIYDAFNELIVDEPGKLDIKIPPGKVARSTSFYYWEDNPFLPDEPFDKLFGPVEAGTARAEMVVTGVVYADKTVDKY